jgi:hypothetical protein
VQENIVKVMQKADELERALLKRDAVAARKALTGGERLQAHL